MDNEKLIEIVREYKCLYDLSDKKYNDNQKKDQAWNEIGRKLKRNGTECKKAWALLRDAFRRSTKKRKDTKSGQVPEKKWKYEDEMSFLLTYMKERPTVCPIPTVTAFDNDDIAQQEPKEEEDIAQSPVAGQQTTDTSPSTPDIRQQTTDTLPSTPDVRQQMAGTLPTTSTQAATLNYPKSKRTNRGQKQTDEIPSTVLMKYIIDSKKNTPPPDDIETFMVGIATTVRSFPPRDRAIAKAKIFEVVSFMEIDILSRPSISNSVVSTPSSYNTNYAENTHMQDTLQDFCQTNYSTDTE